MITIYELKVAMFEVAYPFPNPNPKLMNIK
jgi:hypothetical protein